MFHLWEVATLVAKQKLALRLCVNAGGHYFDHQYVLLE